MIPKNSTVFIKAANPLFKVLEITYIVSHSLRKARGFLQPFNQRNRPHTYCTSKRNWAFIKFYQLGGQALQFMKNLFTFLFPDQFQGISPLSPRMMVKTKTLPNESPSKKVIVRRLPDCPFCIVMNLSMSLQGFNLRCKVIGIDSPVGEVWKTLSVRVCSHCFSSIFYNSRINSGQAVLQI